MYDKITQATESILDQIMMRSTPEEILKLTEAVLMLSNAFAVHKNIETQVKEDS